MNDHPLRLSTGSHRAGTGRGCAMNVISWENGDTTITDFPACSDRMLALIVQRVNDTICRHAESGFLCPACSVEVLRLGHRTVGTGGVLPFDELKRVWVRIAADQARQVLHLARNQPVALRAIEAAEAWAENPTAYTATDAANDAAAAAAAATDAANAAANAATYAATTAAAYAASATYAAATATYAAADAYAADAYAATATYAAADAYAATATYAAADAYAATAAADAYAAATYAAAYAASAADAAATATRLRLAHRAIDQFHTLTGLDEHTPNPHTTTQAVERMLEVAK